MELRLPGSGTLGEFVRGAIVGGLTPDTYIGDTGQTFYAVTPDDVLTAIDLVASRQMEFVGLAEGDIEIQAVDVPGGFFLQRLLTDEFVSYPGTLALDELRAAFLAFLGGDIDCGLTWAEPPPAPERTRRGLFRRS